jgi:hypothetical protein
MEREEIERFIGVTIEENRYVLCMLDAEGKHPRYYSGRNDTQGGREKFLSRLDGRCLALIPDCTLAVLAYERYGERIHILPWDPFWGTWQEAGVGSGRPMARFAAKFLFGGSSPGTVLTEKQRQQVLLDGWNRMLQIERMGDRAQTLMERLATGDEDPLLATEAIGLESESTEDLVGTGETEEDPAKTEVDDGSFLARFAALLEDSY